MANLEELQAAVLGIPGVVGAEVAPRPSGLPSVRVWTDDTRDPAELQAEVKLVVTRAAQASGTVAEPPPAVIREPVPPTNPDRSVSPVQRLAGSKRSGLGRGLDSLIPDAEDGKSPAHLVSIDLSTPPSLEMIAIEESATGVTVRAIDTARNVAEAKVVNGAASINPTIVAAVGELLGEMPPPRLVAVELRDSEAAAVLVVTLEMADTSVTAGAAVVQGGMPFTLGKAAWAAIRSVRP